MKLLHVVHDFDAADAGGTERYTRSVTAELATRHDVSVFTFRLDPDAASIRLDTSSTPDGVGVTTVRRRTGTGLRARLATQREIAAAFADHLRAARPDVVHVQHLTGLSPTLLGIPPALGIPSALTLHDFWFLCPRIHLIRKDGSACTSGPRGGFACVAHCNPASDALGASPARAVPSPSDAAFVYRYRRSMSSLRAAPALIAPSEFVRDFYVRHGLPAERFRVIPHGVEPLAPVASRREPARPVRFAFLGLVSSLKGADRLLDAFESIDPGDATLDLHGPLERREAPGLESRIARIASVRAHGPYSREDLPRLLAGADVVVSPSRALETFSFVAREALSAGVPVIASRTGAMAEAVRDGVDGYLVSGQSELEARIRSLIDEPATIARLSASAPRFPSMADHVSRLEEVYAELAAAPR